MNKALTPERVSRLALIHMLCESGLPFHAGSVASETGVTTRTIYREIDFLRSIGAPLEWSEHRQTFFYSGEFDFVKAVVLFLFHVDGDLVCQSCGELFFSISQDAKYCFSDGCRAAQLEAELRTEVCLECGNEFQTNIVNRKICSEQCRKKRASTSVRDAERRKRVRNNNVAILSLIARFQESSKESETNNE